MFRLRLTRRTGSKAAYRRETPQGKRPPPSVLVFASLCVGLLPPALGAQEDPPSSEPNEPRATILLKDGSRVNGEIVDMKEGQLKVKTRFGGDVPVKWSEIAEIVSRLELRLVLTDQKVLDGTVEPGEGETLSVRTGGGRDWRHDFAVRPVTG